MRWLPSLRKLARSKRSQEATSDGTLAPLFNLTTKRAWDDWHDHPLRKVYEPVALLGKGGSASVWHCIHRVTGKAYALKVVHKLNPVMRDWGILLVVDECDILLCLDHPHVVRCMDVVSDPYNLVMVLELLEGGQLLNQLSHIHQFPECQAADICWQVASALSYLHGRGVIHRDVKPDNVVFTHPKPVTTDAVFHPVPQLMPASTVHGRRCQVDGALTTHSASVHQRSDNVVLQRYSKAHKRAADGGVDQTMVKRGCSSCSQHADDGSLEVKLIDFGLSTPYAGERGKLGTKGFMAPEVLSGGKHTPAMDMYSLGVTLYCLLVGAMPFTKQQVETLSYAQLPLHDVPGFKSHVWHGLSVEAKHLILHLMHPDPSLRLTAAEVLQHAWLARNDEDVGQLRRIASFVHSHHDTFAHVEVTSSDEYDAYRPWLC